MKTHSVAEAKSQLSDLIDRALAGEDVVITRHGHPVVALKPVAKPARRRVSEDDIDWLDRHRVGRKAPRVDSGALLSRMRDEDEK